MVLLAGTSANPGPARRKSVEVDYKKPLSDLFEEAVGYLVGKFRQDSEDKATVMVSSVDWRHQEENGELKETEAIFTLRCSDAGKRENSRAVLQSVFSKADGNLEVVGENPPSETKIKITFGSPAESYEKLLIIWAEKVAPKIIRLYEERVSAEDEEGRRKFSPKHVRMRVRNNEAFKSFPADRQDVLLARLPDGLREELKVRQGHRYPSSGPRPSR